MRHHDTPQSKHRYRGRFFGALAVVLLLVIALVHLWPAPSPSSPEGPFRDRASDQIQIRDIQQTTQSQELTPPPPAPVPPRVVPNNTPIKENIEFDDGPLAVEDPGDDEQFQEGQRDRPTATRQPDTNPRLFRAVQPDYPTAAREENVRARVEVAVQVSETGRVKNVSILKRWRLTNDGHPRLVGQLDYGLEEAALVAARQSRFRPAQKNGSPVASQTTLTFEFGPSSN